MSDENTAYYRAAGKSLEAILKWQKDRIEIHRRRIEFAKKHGTDEVFSTVCTLRGSTIFGLIFKSDPPKPWKKAKGNGIDYWKPDNSKAGKEIAKELKSLYIGSPGEDVGGSYIAEGRFWTPGFQMLGGEWIVSHHEKAKPPIDAIPMKRSEFWAMKEASEI